MEYSGWEKKKEKKTCGSGGVKGQRKMKKKKESRGGGGGQGITVRVSRGQGRRDSHHVSVLDVKMPSMKASGGIHFTGSMARPPFL